MGGVCYNKHNAETAQNLLSLECINLNRMAVRVPTHVLALGVQFVHRRRTSLHVSCMQLIPQNPSALGLRLHREYFTCTIPECTKHTLRPINTFYWPDKALYTKSYIKYTHESQYPHTWSPFMWPIDSTRRPSWPVWHRHRCPITERWAQHSGPVHKLKKNT